MKVYKVNTKNRELKLKVNIETKKPSIVRIIGYDPTKPNTKYFDITKGNKQTPLKGINSVTLKMPVSPKVLHVKVFDKNNPNGSDVGIQKNKVYVHDLLQKGLNTERGYKESFMQLPRKIAEGAGYIPTDAYYSGDKYNHLIVVSDNILHRETNKPMPTPARVSTNQGVVEISTDYLRDYTVPMRMFIICHEWAHHVTKSSNEFIADSKGVELYLKQGFPEIEAMYAFTKVFDDEFVNAEKEKRAEIILKKLKNHSRDEW